MIFGKNSGLVIPISMVLCFCILFWWILGYAHYPIKIIEPSHYICKVKTDNNIILEFPDGKISNIPNTPYNDKNIEVIKIFEVNTYKDTTITYKVKQ